MIGVAFWILLAGLLITASVTAVEYYRFLRLFKAAHPEAYREAHASRVFDGYGPPGFWLEALYVENQVRTDNALLIRVRRTKTLMRMLVVLLIFFFFVSISL